MRSLFKLRHPCRPKHWGVRKERKRSYRYKVPPEELTTAK